MRQLKLASGAARSHRLARLSAGALGGLGAMLSKAWHPHSRGRLGEGELPEGEKLFFVLASVALVLLAGLMSGLTLGLMSLDVVDLQVILRSGSEREKRYARKIAPVVKHPHFLLVTLVLCNAFATETLPIFLDRLTTPLAAVALSMSVVLLFGEVIPQAVCSRYGLAVGAQAAWLVRVLMVVSYPIAAPLAAVLDRTLGGGVPSALFRRAQLKALVDVHAEDEGLGGNLTVDEVAVIRGALDLSAKTATCCLTPIERVFALPTDARLDSATLRAIVASGHSRVPVHSPGDKEAIVGVILVKELLLVDRDFEEEHEEEGEGGGTGGGGGGGGDNANEASRDSPFRSRLRRSRPPPLVADLKLRTLPHLRADTKLYDMLRLFETGRCHMAVLVTPPRPLGAVSEGEGGGSSEDDDDYDDDDDDDDDDAEEERRRRRRRQRRVPTRDFSDDASDADGVAAAAAAAAAPPPSSLGRTSLGGGGSRPSSSASAAAAVPVPSFPSTQSRSALAEVLCARGSRLTPPSSASALQTTAATAAMATATTAATTANGGGGSGEIEPAAAAAAAALPAVPELPASPGAASSSSSSSSSVEDSLGGRVLGIVTIEDVLEELIGHAILDETDRFEDRHGERRVNARALAASLPSHLRELLREHSIRVGGVGGGGVGGGGGGGGVAERGGGASPQGYGIGIHHAQHLGRRGSSLSGGGLSGRRASGLGGVGGAGGGGIGGGGNAAAAASALGGSRLLPPAARQAVIGNISGTVPPHGNTSQYGADLSPLAAAVAARRSRAAGPSLDGGSPPSLLRQPLLSTTRSSTAAMASPPPPPPAGKRWT